MPTKRTSFRPDVIEHQLAHAVRDPLGRAYNRTAHLAERRRMMTVWADYLDKLKADVKVTLRYSLRLYGPRSRLQIPQMKLAS